VILKKSSFSGLPD